MNEANKEVEGDDARDQRYDRLMPNQIMATMLLERAADTFNQMGGGSCWITMALPIAGTDTGDEHTVKMIGLYVGCQCEVCTTAGNEVLRITQHAAAQIMAEKKPEVGNTAELTAAHIEEAHGVANG